MPGILYVVATPIGNLEDVTLRALRILREASIVAAEDTRHTARLLQHYSISTRTTSLHEHNERARTPSLVARLLAGDSVALVSDAGTPGVSDPGAHLVAAAHAAGIRVEPVPGPSAVMALVSAAGFGATEFAFLGFPPSRSNARKKWLVEAAKVPLALLLYESPHRVRAMLEEALAILGDRKAAMGRELTKAHEKLVVRPISGHLEQLGDPRGEYVFLIAAPDSAALASGGLLSADIAAHEFGELTNNGGLDRRQAIKTLAERYGVRAKDVFNLLEDAKKSVE